MKPSYYVVKHVDHDLFLTVDCRKVENLRPPMVSDIIKNAWIFTNKEDAFNLKARLGDQDDYFVYKITFDRQDTE